GEPCALDDQATEARHLPALAPRMQLFDRDRELATDGAAEAARLQQHHGVIDALQQVMVKADLAELVDQDGGVGECGVAQRAWRRVGLAETRKPGVRVAGMKAGLSIRPARGPALGPANGSTNRTPQPDDEVGVERIARSARELLGGDPQMAEV